MLLVFAKSAGNLWRGKEDEVMKAFEGEKKKDSKRLKD